MDYIEEFERINDNLNEALGGFLNKITNAFKSGQSSAGQTSKSKPSTGQSIKDIGAQKKLSDLEKYKLGMETGQECLGGVGANGMFSSDIGSNSALLGSKGQVKNIMPFLRNTGLSKRDMRCYNIQKDPLKIKWLFDGDYIADVLDWDSKQKKAIFQGKWNSGIFNGIKNQSPGEKSETPPTLEYFVFKNKQQNGPYNIEQISSLINRNIVKPETFVWTKGYTHWAPASQDKFLYNTFVQLGKIVPTTAKQQPISNLTSPTQTATQSRVGRKSATGKVK